MFFLAKVIEGFGITVKPGIAFKGTFCLWTYKISCEVRFNPTTGAFFINATMSPITDWAGGKFFFFFPIYSQSVVLSHFSGVHPGRFLFYALQGSLDWLKPTLTKKNSLRNVFFSAGNEVIYLRIFDKFILTLQIPIP